MAAGLDQDGQATRSRRKTFLDPAKRDGEYATGLQMDGRHDRQGRVAKLTLNLVETGRMFRIARWIAIFVAIAFQAPADATKMPDVAFDYVRREQGGFVEGAVDNEYEVVCGYSTQAKISEAGYLSIYKRAYWLLGVPYQSWNFDVRTEFPEDTNVAVSLVIDGRTIDYPEKITIINGIASSGGDLCVDGLGGYCPNQATAQILWSIDQKLRSAKSLMFIVRSKQKIERLIMRADFGLVLTGVDACIGRLLVKTPRSIP